MFYGVFFFLLQIYFMCSTEVCRTDEKTCKEQCFDGKVSLNLADVTTCLLKCLMKLFASRQHKDFQL